MIQFVFSSRILLVDEHLEHPEHLLDSTYIGMQCIHYCTYCLEGCGDEHVIRKIVRNEHSSISIRCKLAGFVSENSHLVRDYCILCGGGTVLYSRREILRDPTKTTKQWQSG